MGSLASGTGAGCGCDGWRMRDRWNSAAADELTSHLHALYPGTKFVVE